MKKFLIIIYLIAALVLNIIIGILVFNKTINFNSTILETGIYCFVFGVIGGIVQCFRGCYLHTALLKDWNNDWNIWYYLRPLVSGILGLVSLVFIKAGILVFSTQSGENLMPYLAIAFIAGYNVQNFLKKLEEVSRVSLNIKETEE